MRSAVRRALALTAVWLPACAQLTTYRSDQDHLDPPPQHVLFVADGAGDYRACSNRMRDTVRADGLPLEVVTFVWSHGYLRNFADHTDYAFARFRGRELAERVLEQRQARPDLPVSLVGHSAGCGVVLAAAEQLPPDTIERIILLAPSVSADYDVRPALHAARLGIDNFFSPEDWLWLGLFIDLVGAMDDRSSTRTAGRYGFTVTSGDDADQPLWSKLRQHRWKPELWPLGHDGEHYGAYQPDHLRRFVLPLFE
jgi:pimeloyl-ACP methyl ester carboxylesterase